MLILASSCSRRIGDSAPNSSAKIDPDIIPDQSSPIARIGISLPLTGHTAFGGIRSREGIEMAYKDLPESQRSRIILTFEDDKCLGKDGLDAIHNLVEVGKSDYLIGPICNAALVPNYDFLKEKGIPDISLGIITDKSASLGESHFTLSPRVRDLMRPLAEYAYDTKGAKRLAILYLEDEFGQESTKYFEEYFTKKGGYIVTKEHFGPTETDFKTHLTKIEAARPDGVFLMSYGSMIIAQIRQMDDLGFKTQIYAPVPAHDPDVITALGSKAEGIIYSYPYEFTGSKVQTAFESRLKEKNVAPEYYRTIAYDSARALFQAIGSCGPDRDCVKSYLSSLKDFDGAGGTIFLDADGIGVRKISINMIADGKFQTIG